MSFKQSYDAGDFFQRQVISHLESRDFQVETSEKYGRFGLWDIKVMGAEEQHFELKFDLQTKDTGNVCVEVFKKDRQTGEKKPGGLSETISDCYIQGYLGKSEVHIIDTDTLRELVKGYDEISEGGDDNCIFVLIPYDEFTKKCEVLFHRTINSKNRLSQTRLKELQDMVTRLAKT